MKALNWSDKKVCSVDTIETEAFRMWFVTEGWNYFEELDHYVNKNGVEVVDMHDIIDIYENL